MKRYLCFFTLCVLAATRPVWTLDAAKPGASSSLPPTFPGWSAGPVSPDWEKLTPSARDARFSKDFPGVTGVFSDGRTTYVVRWVEQPTRRLHPAADCLRALGYDIAPRPLREKADGTLWSTCEATREGETVEVHERLFGADGRSWTDVSTWFWHASLGRAQGPWWAVTSITPQSAPRRH